MDIQDYSFILMFIATLGWAIGLVNPKAVMRWVKKPTRLQLTIIYLSVILVSFVGGQASVSSDIFQKVEQWLADGVHGDAPASAPLTTDQPQLIVHYIDAGQGDATLLEGHNFTILIDAGRHDSREVLEYLDQLALRKLDLVVGTHPHSDHIGQLAEVLQRYEVQEVWLSGETHTSKTFEKVIDTIAEKSMDYYEPRAGEGFQIGDARIDVVSPKALNGDLNESSISMRIQFGEISFLFTGDAEEGAEQEMLRSGLTLKADIFHLGHHGSSTSNTEPFLKKVQPELAIYSAGEGNSYGHPHREVVERLNDLGIRAYGTEKYGTIKVITDGSTYSVETEKQGTGSN